VATEAEATAVGFRGPPRSWRTESNLFGRGSADGALTCRMNATAGGLADVQTVDDFVPALRRKAYR
jgi:hypothetical protein